jgi:host factor-I protein
MEVDGNADVEKGTEHEARMELDRLLSDPQFHLTERHRNFLKYVAQEMFEGRAATVKAYAIAVDVFGRPCNFDRINDPIVRFLNSVRKQKTALTIFLTNGVKLTGIVTSFDNYCVFLRRDGHSQLVFEHAISTIMPSQPVQLFEVEECD